MSIQTICRVIETGSVNQSVRAYRTGKRIHLTMETLGEGTPSSRRNFEDRLEAALLRRIQRARMSVRNELERSTDDVCVSYLA